MNTKRISGESNCVLVLPFIWGCWS